MLDKKRRPPEDGSDGGRAARQWDIMGEVPGGGLEDSRTLGKKTVRVPFGHVWVEGDNWRKTADSNMYGPVCLLS